MPYLINFFKIYLILLISFIPLKGDEPLSVYLTWKHDPLTTMTVQWITGLDHSGDDIHFWPGNDSEKTKDLKGTHERMPAFFPHLIHRIELTDLMPGTLYSFRLNKEDKVYKFKTMPSDLEKPINFVVGGDVFHDGIEYVLKTNRAAAAVNPDFVLIGGDIAYCDSKPRSTPGRDMRWIEWLIAWGKTMVTNDGRLIPIIPALGNHDVLKGFNQKPSQAAFFYAIFDVNGYRVLDFQDYLSIIALDSGHTHPIEGRQAAWLNQTLKNRPDVLHKLALYHVPAFPSVRDYHNKRSHLVRKYWSPLFEKWGLNFALEHHDHAYKRTQPIKYHKVDPNGGVLYFGDGAWGVKNPRRPKKPKNVWYLAQTAQKRHVIHVILSKDKREFKAIDDQGIPFDYTKQILEPKLAAPKKST